MDLVHAAGAAPSDEQLARLDGAIRSLTTENLIWTSGYLAGLARAASVSRDDIPATPAHEAANRLTILYASQTGNSKRVAEQLALEAAQRNVNAALVSMADYRVQDLKRETALLIVVSTHGEGDPPDDAEELHEFLASSRAPALPDLQYSVLALGDSSYSDFCRTGRDFDERLAKLGARRLIQRVDCDLDFDEPARAWSAQALEQAAEILERDSASQPPALQAVAGSRYTAERPLLAEVLVNQKITGRDSGKDVRHIEFSTNGAGLQYQPGDALGVVCLNPPALIAELLKLLGLDAGTPLEDSTLGEVLSTRYEITVASVGFVQRYAELAGSAELQRLAGADARPELLTYLHARQVVDVVREHPCSPAAADFVTCLRRLKPRLYSIASSPQASEDEVAITVAAVRYRAFGSEHWGAASTYLADRCAVGARVGVYVEPNPRFRLPKEPGTPIIMVGPGTGVAPFRAFLEHRESAADRGRSWLFFGDREFRNDFLYQTDWARWRKRGVLSRMDVAFSRDQPEKNYVQDRIRASAADVFAWLEQGAHLYVCGDASRMASDVHDAFVDVIESAGQRSRSAAELYMKELKRSGRYQRDVY